MAQCSQEAVIISTSRPPSIGQDRSPTSSPSGSQIDRSERLSQERLVYGSHRSRRQRSLMTPDSQSDVQESLVLEIHRLRSDLEQALDRNDAHLAEISDLKEEVSMLAQENKCLRTEMALTTIRQTASDTQSLQQMDYLEQELKSREDTSARFKQSLERKTQELSMLEEVATQSNHQIRDLKATLRERDRKLAQMEIESSSMTAILKREHDQSETIANLELLVADMSSKLVNLEESRHRESNNPEQYTSARCSVDSYIAIEGPSLALDLCDVPEQSLPEAVSSEMEVAASSEARSHIDKLTDQHLCDNSKSIELDRKRTPSLNLSSSDGLSSISYPSSLCDNDLKPTSSPSDDTELRSSLPLNVRHAGRQRPSQITLTGSRGPTDMSVSKVPRRSLDFEDEAYQSSSSPEELCLKMLRAKKICEDQRRELESLRAIILDERIKSEQNIQSLKAIYQTSTRLFGADITRQDMLDIDRHHNSAFEQEEPGCTTSVRLGNSDLMKALRNTQIHESQDDPRLTTSEMMVCLDHSQEQGSGTHADPAEPDCGRCTVPCSAVCFPALAKPTSPKSLSRDQSLINDPRNRSLDRSTDPSSVIHDHRQSQPSRVSHRHAVVNMSATSSANYARSYRRDSDGFAQVYHLISQGDEICEFRNSLPSRFSAELPRNPVAYEIPENSPLGRPLTSASSSSSSSSSFSDTESVDHDELADCCSSLASNNPMIAKITQCVIGTEMYKYVRSTKRTIFGKRTRDDEISHRHKRFVRLKPNEGVICWYLSKPAGMLFGSKNYFIDEMFDVEDHSPVLPNQKIYDRSILIISEGRSLKFTAPDEATHVLWVDVIQNLLRLRMNGSTMASLGPLTPMLLPKHLKKEQLRNHSFSIVNPTSARPRPISRGTTSSPGAAVRTTPVKSRRRKSHPVKANIGNRNSLSSNPSSKATSPLLRNRKRMPTMTGPKETGLQLKPEVVKTEKDKAEAAAKVLAAFAEGIW